MRETEKIGPPWEMELTRDEGVLVEVTIRATGSAGLGFDAIREATNAIVATLRQERPKFDYSTMGALRRSYKSGGGRMTPEYLAQLAVSYAEIAKNGRAVIPELATAIRGNPATVKGHVVKAREEGYLTKTTPGKEGGEPTDKALRIVANGASDVAET